VVLGALGQAALLMLVHVVWSVLVGVNLATSPRWPWAPLLMLFLLVLLWRFLDGRSGPLASRPERHARLQWHWPKAALRGWATAATVASMAAFFLLNTHSYRVTDVVGRLATEGMAELPLWTGLSIGLVTSAVAAFVEESAFRGYMQSELRTRFGLAATAALVAVAFAAFHLYGRTFAQWTQGLGDWLAISLVFSGLVFLSESLLPALLGHFFLDAALFSLDFLEDVLRPLRRPLWGLPLSLGAACLIVLALASLLAFWQLSRAARALR
jgi:membrane protease YdiL (CAAX protease family)